MLDGQVYKNQKRTTFYRVFSFDDRKKGIQQDKISSTKKKRYI